MGVCGDCYGVCTRISSNDPGEGAPRDAHFGGRRRCLSTRIRAASTAPPTTGICASIARSSAACPSRAAAWTILCWRASSILKPELDFHENREASISLQIYSGNWSSRSRHTKTASATILQSVPSFDRLRTPLLRLPYAPSCELQIGVHEIGGTLWCHQFGKELLSVCYATSMMSIRR